jgi:hypothetical protein
VTLANNGPKQVQDKMPAIMVNPNKYPKSDSFISEMTKESVERIIKSGWAIKDTLFFELSYCAISGVGAGIARDYRHQVYYTTFSATEGVIPALTDLQLRVVTEHEQDEIHDSVRHAIGDSLEAPFTTFDEEIERHKSEMQPIEERYGKDIVDSTIRRVAEMSSTKLLIPRYVLSFWISSYLLNRFEHLGQHAASMTSGMLSEKQRSFFIQLLAKVMKEYGSNAPTEEWSKLYLSAIRA